MSEPAWDIAKLFPLQGAWSDEEYLEFSARHPRVEFDDGVIEVLPVPTRSHQNAVAYFLMLLRDLAKKTGGRASFAGTRLKLPGNKYREPDLLFATKDHADFEREDQWTGADLVMEVVSGSADDHERDYVKKRREYARGGVVEYWIIDPETRTVLLLVLRDGRYVEHGTFATGERVSSPTFEGVVADVAEIFEAT